MSFVYSLVLRITWNRDGILPSVAVTFHFNDYRICNFDNFFLTLKNIEVWFGKRAQTTHNNASMWTCWWPTRTVLLFCHLLQTHPKTKVLKTGLELQESAGCQIRERSGFWWVMKGRKMCGSLSVIYII